jgi:hypothetical protein
MDDLNGLDWSQPAKKAANTPAAFPSFRQSPTPQLSGRSTPLSSLPVQQSGPRVSPAATHPFKPPSKPATPANDSFASLVSGNKSKAPASSLSLQERQNQIQAEKLRLEAERRKHFDTTFGTADSTAWDTLGSSKSTPEPTAFGAPRPAANLSGSYGLSKTINKPFAGLDTSSRRAEQSPDEDDLLAAFNSAAPVDKSSHFPVPSNGSGRSTPAYSENVSRRNTPLPQPSASSSALMDDDDDMFGLKQMAQKPTSSAPPTSTNNGDDDILGLLSKPVEEFQRKSEPTPVAEGAPANGRRPSPGPQNAHDKAVAELVDMGFPAERSAIALATTESGLDVQAAVGWLLNQAHAESKQKGQDRSQDRSQRDQLDERPQRTGSRPNARDNSREERSGGSRPAWMREEETRSRSGQRGHPGQSQEKDVAQMASDIGSTLFKSANSLWKTGRKQVQKAVADLQQDGDPNVPKWMRDAPAAESASRSSKSQRAEQAATDEAMMLEAGGRPDKQKGQTDMRRQADSLPVRQRREQEVAQNGFSDRGSSRSPVPQPQLSGLDKRPATRLTREELEEQSAQAYISPARRKKTTPQPQIDLFAPGPAASTTPPRQAVPAQSKNPFLQSTSTTKARKPAVTPPPPRPRAPPRQIPPVSSSALNQSASDRQKGSEAFKRGDYSAAHTAYSSALRPLPQSHPVTIIVLCNRAVTNIKVGDPKAAIADADAALAIIGVSKGEGEKIASGGTEGDKDMKEFYGKAMMRKAEALENMEKWSDAHKVWKEAVQDGVGGAISIQGRNRCEKAVGGGNTSTTPAAARRPPPRKPAAPKQSALSALGGGPANDSEAVKRMKAANAAADKADDEKFALTDQVDAKLFAWKGTKADNLRALLGSLDKVLWEDAGWKKVNMGDLVMPNKVKIIYMKAIAKVHPDKVRSLLVLHIALLTRFNRFPKRQPQSKR